MMLLLEEFICKTKHKTKKPTFFLAFFVNDIAPKDTEVMQTVEAVKHFKRQSVPLSEEQYLSAVLMRCIAWSNLLAYSAY